ncbi:MAG: alpha/beta fold hydrolase [Chloroflexota bacterium]
MSFDPISQDPPHDTDYPARMSELEVTVSGALLNGVIYHPSGEGAHPLIVLLHGLPGHERNLDLAQILRRAGYITCVFHYKGAWGSGGDYRFSHILEDVQAVLAHFRQTDIAQALQIDTDNIITIGHSVGGWASLMMASMGEVTQAVSLSHANIGLWGQQLLESPAIVRPMMTNMLNGILGPLQGVTADDIIAELEAHADAWDLMRHASTLANKNLLIVGAKRDQIVSPFDHHMPVVQAIQAVDDTHLSSQLLASDHSYSGNRIALARLLLDWLS